jgi:hypothetical protein
MLVMQIGGATARSLRLQPSLADLPSSEKR